MVLWINAVRSNRATLDSLADPGKFTSLDRKLLTAIKGVISGEFKRKQGLFQDELTKEDKIFRGRQALWRILRHFEGNKEAENLNNIEDRMALDFRGNIDQLESWVNSFDSLLATMKSQPDESTLHGLILKPLRKIIKGDPQSEFRLDLQLHDRAKVGDELRSYDGIRKLIDDTLERRREANLRREQLEAMNKASATPIKATPAADAKAPKTEPKVKETKPNTPKVTAAPAEVAKTQSVCYDFRDKGSCSRGDKCKFSHGDGAASPRSEAGSTGSKKEKKGKGKGKDNKKKKGGDDESKGFAQADSTDFAEN